MLDANGGETQVNFQRAVDGTDELVRFVVKVVAEVSRKSNLEAADMVVALEAGSDVENRHVQGALVESEGESFNGCVRLSLLF